MRIFEVLQGNNKWLPCKITDIKNMDKFRIIDDGKLFISSFGESEFEADGTAYLGDDNVMQIDIR